MHNVAEFSGLVLDLTTPQDALYASIAVDDDRMTGNPLGGKNVYCAEGGDGRYYGVYYRQSQAGGTVYHIKRTSSGSFGGASQFSLDLGTAVNSCPFGNEFTNTANDFVGLSPVNVDGDVTVECAISPAPPPPRPSVAPAAPPAASTPWVAIFVPVAVVLCCCVASAVARQRRDDDEPRRAPPRRAPPRTARLRNRV